MKNLIRLYPHAWRERYEDEFDALLEQHRLSVIDVLNISFKAARIRVSEGRSRKRNPIGVAAVAGMVIASLGVSVGLVGFFSLRGAAAQASPLIVTKAVIYHRVHGQWTETHTVHAGEATRYLVSFHRNGRMWVPVQADLFMQNRLARVAKSHHPIVYRAKLRTVQRSSSSASFSADLSVPTALSGQFYLQFNLYGPHRN
jgi:hypothetical protein